MKYYKIIKFIKKIYKEDCDIPMNSIKKIVKFIKNNDLLNEIKIIYGYCIANSKCYPLAFFYLLKYDKLICPIGLYEFTGELPLFYTFKTLIKHYDFDKGAQLILLEFIKNIQLEINKILNI